jgi:mannosyltransferase OCH1-like enzyme
MVSCADMAENLEHHRQRSEFIRGLVQRPVTKLSINDRYLQGPPRTIVQFWHDPGEVPADIEECIASWTRWTTSGFTHSLYNERSARELIGDSLGARHQHAFDRCYHPAMQADYFRLCYLWVKGGFYVDADDVCVGPKIDGLFDDGRLKVQPLCYDILLCVWR